MATTEVGSEHLKKLKLLKDSGINPYPAESSHTHTILDFTTRFPSLADSQEQVLLSGRIMSWRDQGGILFLDLFDGTGRVQILLAKDNVSNEQFQLFVSAANVGDIVEF